MGFTTTFVIEEIAYFLLTRSIADDFNNHPIEVIRDNPEVVRKYTDKLHKAITIIFSMNNISVLDTPAELIFSMVKKMQPDLLTWDALYLAVMGQNNIQNIASFDSDFDRFDQIMRWGNLIHQALPLPKHLLNLPIKPPGLLHIPLPAGLNDLAQLPSVRTQPPPDTHIILL